MGFYYFPIILVIDLNYFGAQIIPDLASWEPLKTRSLDSLPALVDWQGSVWILDSLCENALYGKQRRKQRDLAGGSCVVQVGNVA